ncbi:hypothetical protein [Duganella sp. FT27W]|uniref:hypothetical protein n=1 Tax=Duganella sp. FT27W TaxID=2654636 RepID=UPI00128AEF7F|nr:hypothetical protein [Duganella sp. FT27W]MPQ55101.1 hypothetical protein [Duganella sp. FT27W]
MHTATLLPSRPCGMARLPGPQCPVLSLGADMDGLGLIWTLSATVPPHQRLGFALAVHASGGLSLLIDADRGFLNVERIARCTAALTLARRQGAYRAGYAFAQLVEALGYGERDTRGFELFDPADCAAPAAFVAGFGAAVAQSLETDVMRVVGSALAAPVPLVERLRCWIDAHGATAMVAGDVLQEALWQP